MNDIYWKISAVTEEVWETPSSVFSESNTLYSSSGTSWYGNWYLI